MSTRSTSITPRVACIEAGGTKMVVSIGTTVAEIRDNRHVITTRDPSATTREIQEWFASQNTVSDIDAMGIASFGPLDNADYRISAFSPKVEWRGWDWLPLASEFVPRDRVGFDTDTNGAAWAESLWGATASSAVSVYLTVGTGIGGGIISSGEILRGLSHSEMGHVMVRRHPEDSFAGACPVHGDCLEGLASGTAIEKRWGVPGTQLAPDHAAWVFESFYLSEMLATVAAIVAPERVILGGGVMDVPGLREESRRRYREAFVTSGHPAIEILAPALGHDSGLLGAFALGRARAQS